MSVPDPADVKATLKHSHGLSSDTTASVMGTAPACRLRGCSSLGCKKAFTTKKGKVERCLWNEHQGRWPGGCKGQRGDVGEADLCRAGGKGGET